MKKAFFALFVLVPALAGCQSRRCRFTNIGPGPHGNETGIPSVSIEQFARQQGISREEALEHFRAGQAAATKTAQAKRSGRGLAVLGEIEGRNRLYQVKPADAAAAPEPPPR